MVAAARNANASACIFIAFSSRLGALFGGVESRGKPLLFAVISRTLPETRASDAGRMMPPQNLAVSVLADHVVQENILGYDGIAFHAHHLGDVRDPAGAV